MADRNGRGANGDSRRLGVQNRHRNKRPIRQFDPDLRIIDEFQKKKYVRGPECPAYPISQPFVTGAVKLPGVADLADTIIGITPSVGQAIIWDGSHWVNGFVSGSGSGSGTGVISVKVINSNFGTATATPFSGRVDSSNTHYILSHPYVAGTVEMFLGGAAHDVGVHFEETDPATAQVDLLITPDTGDSLKFVFDHA